MSQEVWIAALGIALILILLDVYPKAGALLLIAIVLVMLARFSKEN